MRRIDLRRRNTPTTTRECGKLRFQQNLRARILLLHGPARLREGSGQSLCNVARASAGTRQLLQGGVVLSLWMFLEIRRDGKDHPSQGNAYRFSFAVQPQS